MVRRVTIAIIAAAVLGLIGFFVLASRPATTAIANAIFAATGARVRHSIRPEAVRQALAHQS